MLGRVWRAAAAACFVSAGVQALEGTPPFEWLVAGDTLPELTAGASVGPDLGYGAGFAGSGRGEDSMKARRYLAAPVTFRYGLWSVLEAYAVAPFYWGDSPQHFINYATAGPPEESRATLSGADFGDPALGARWRFWSGETEGTGAVLTVAGIFPLGTNVWANSQFNYVTSGSPRPDFAVGDGAMKVLVSAQGLVDGPAWRLDVLAGYLYRFPVEAAAIEPGASTITVRAPGSVLAWVRPAWKLSEDTWLTGRLDGFWSAGGSFGTTGLLARYPATLPVVLDSYQHLVRSAGGMWAGAGVRQAFGEGWSAAAGLLAPVAVHGMYRFVRLDASVSWTWKP